MRRTLASLLVLFALLATTANLVAFAQQKTAYDTPESAAGDRDFAVQGEYAAAATGMQVISLGEGDFEVVLYGGGLPGAGWDKVPPQRIEADAEAVLQIIKSKSLKRVDRKSPTLGAKPPAGSTVLFDGSQASLDANWQSGAKRTDDGLLVQGATTKGTFRDYTLHVEFRTPFQPKATGQGRGNSGIYHQGRYETQILDSFGLAGKNNEAGGIYEVRDPDLNACFPPLAWQTYDIDFTAARFDASGKKVSDAKLTVRLNGILVQSETAVPKPTRAAPLGESAEPGPIHLQDHGNPVRFRNIWITPRDADKEARRPIVPGYERLLTDDALGGRALIGELACAACHATQDKSLSKKTGPVLDRVGERLRIDAILAMASNAHATKTGTTMPDLMHVLSDAERQERAAALASFLATTGSIIDRSGDSQAIERGEGLFHSVGCVACHAPRRGNASPSPTSVPLGDLTAKYTVDSLSKFLLNPHAVRPSGNMPKIVNGSTEARDVACYLLGEKIVAPGAEQFATKVYHGSWDNLPNFDDLKPVKTGSTIGLDLTYAGRQNNFAMVFEAFLPIPKDGDYKFIIASDDGSRLLIDDKEVVKNDGVHPRTEKTGRAKLTAGVHRLRLEYFEGGGEEVFTAEIEGPEIGRAPISMFVTTDEKGEIKQELIPSKFKPNPDLVSKGREYFTRLGCANCHSLKVDGATIVSDVKAPPMELLNSEKGCLATNVPKGAPDYELSNKQRSAIAASLKSLSQPLDDSAKLHLQLASRNCYACHSRGTIGGPETGRDPLFGTKTPEMGNEGRVPPPLTGVGDKLRSEVIEQIIEKGSKDRPYMLTRMPAFGKEIAASIRERLVSLDLKETQPIKVHASSTDEGKQLISSGRKLVGGEGLACIKCHVFGNKATPGLQAMDLLRMTERLRDDWFRRYMLAPAEYRPGTRMPLSFPDGKSTLTSIYDGDAEKQISAMWHYLSEGKNARPPAGLDAQSIVLTPEKRPIIYRNFIEGLSARGIAVGYPERVNLAWDANQMSLSLAWKNEFIDASKHWVGRGPGFQGPLGDFVIRPDASAPVSVLDSAESAWPKESARDRGYRFLGYQLNSSGQPTFRYRTGEVLIEDLPTPVITGNNSVVLKRQLKVTVEKPTTGLTVRLATGAISQETDGSFKVDDLYRIRAEGAEFKIVTIDGKQELRASLPSEGSISIVETILW